MHYKEQFKKFEKDIKFKSNFSEKFWDAGVKCVMVDLEEYLNELLAAGDPDGAECIRKFLEKSQ